MPDPTQPLPAYVDGNAVRAAIKAAAQAAAFGPDIHIGDLIQQATYDRFLCRVFSSPASTFILKGGTGMLARIPRARSTRDIDLASSRREVDDAVAELVELAGIDLEDHFRFVFANRADRIGGENQPYTDGVNVRFDVYVGVTKHGVLSIDLAAGHTPTGPVGERAPRNRLPLPRLRTYDYVLYPLGDQIADKVCATLAVYGTDGKASSREKDLVDLLSIALHEEIDASQLRIALATQLIMRRLDPVVEFRIPGTWGPGYSKLARRIPFLRDYPTARQAVLVVKAFVDPVLDGRVEEGAWVPSELRWRTVTRPTE